MKRQNKEVAAKTASEAWLHMLPSPELPSARLTNRATSLQRQRKLIKVPHTIYKRETTRNRLGLCVGYPWSICGPLHDIAHPIQVEKLRQIKDAPVHTQAKIAQALHLVYAISQEHWGNHAAAGPACNTRYQRYNICCPSSGVSLTPPVLVRKTAAKLQLR
jgi:hypothetical protein